MDPNKIRNIAIIAHVDHGKTTLVDRLLQQSGTVTGRAAQPERILDSNDLERERGITILSKNTAVRWRDYHINIVDTPGHADFGGEVERVLSMVDSVLLLVDAVEGPMPQTRFVTQKAFSHGLKPILVVNKIDRDGARPDWVIDQTFDLFDSLGASEEQLDFKIVYASALRGYASLDPAEDRVDMGVLFETIVEEVAPPDVARDGGFQMQVSSLDYSSYLGAIGIGRVKRGEVTANSRVSVIDRNGRIRDGRILQIFGFKGLEKLPVERAVAGEIVAVTGIDRPQVSDTFCDPDCQEALPALTVDEPTVQVTLQVNTSPFAGMDGKYLTSRQIGERLERELIYNVALKVEPGLEKEQFQVSGRGELHLSILLEIMRREGFEVAVSRPDVILKNIDGQLCEPFEDLTLDVEEGHQGVVMEAIGQRRGKLKDMQPDAGGRVRLDYHIPSRGLIGFHSEFMTITSGTGLIYHVFAQYRPFNNTPLAGRRNGVLISSESGKALGYALQNLQNRGRLFIGPGEQVYRGQVVGIHSRENDLTVNPLKGRQLTNIRAAGKDENVLLTPPVRMSLEQALDFIDDDELLELTPTSVRLRKKLLHEHDRKRASRVTAV